jgi:predicted transcriptional regulator
MARPPNIAPETEKAILLYLYEHPKGPHSTYSLAGVLEDNSINPEALAAEIKAASGVLETSESPPARAKASRRPEDVQKDVEALIQKEMVRGGKRTGTPGNITHTDIQLTQKGERAAIDIKKNPPQIDVHVLLDAVNAIREMRERES